MNDIDQDSLILDSVARFLEREVKPHVHALEHDDIWPAEIVEGMQQLGLFGATIGAQHGGLGLSTGTYAKIVDTNYPEINTVDGICKLNPETLASGIVGS